MHEGLTKPQRYTLMFLEHRDATDWRNPSLRPRIGMLRLMEERGLVGRNVHGRWHITKAGRAALQPKEPGDAE